uniref:DNA-directed RNA polymerase I subunit RPA34 isoform X1 n=1 Tax=Pogona vitticeps TaxID=103695 RepID=A0ABM5ESK9_9SAUR
MEALGRRAAPEAAPRFECPGDFSAVPFAPGPPFSPEMLQDPTKQLLLIRAPANFSPESLNGHLVPLSGLQTLKVQQPDRTYKLYGIQATPGESSSCARLLAPSDHRGQIGCAPPFAGSLSVWERFGDPSANQILLPVANRLAPQIPEGLKQRFLPFGGQLKRPLPPSRTRDAETPPRKKKKKKKRQLYTMGYLGDPEEQQPPVGRDLEASFGESTAPLEGGTSHQREEEQQEKRTVAEGGEVLGLSGAVEELPEQETQASSSWVASSQDSFFSGEAEELSHRIKKKKKKKHKEEVVENKDPLPDLNSANRQSEDEPQRQGQLEPQAEGNGDPGVEGLVQHKHKKKKKHQEDAVPAQADLSSPKEEAGRDPWEGSGLGNVVDGSLDLSEEGPRGELPGHKSKKKKKKKEKVEEGKQQQQPLGQEAGPVLLELIAVKQEQTGWDELDAASGEGIGRTDSLELSLEVPVQKHKKKKKKKEQESEAP